jgi:subfamily B ATP-binding cassette protein MsbA
MLERLKFFWRVVGVYKYSAILLFVLMLAAAFSEVLGLGIIMPLLEVIINPGDMSKGSVRYLQPLLKHFSSHYHLMVLGGLMVGLTLIKNILLVLRTGFSTHFVYRFRRLWQCGIMEKCMFAEYPYLLSQKQGTVLNNLLVEPGRAAKSLQQIILFSFRAILALCLYSLLLFADWRITLGITVISFGLVLVLRKTTYTYSIGLGKKKIDLSQQLAVIGAENIGAIRQIKIFSSEGNICRRFAQRMDAFVRILVRFYVIRGLPRPVTESLVVIGIVSVLLYLQHVSKVSLSEIIPVVGLFIVTSERFFPIVSGLFAERMNILTFIPSLKLVHNLYISRVDREELDKGAIVDELREDIVLEEIHFSYNKTNQLFQGLDIIFPKGKVTAIVGSSGAGKSTIVDLMVGLFRQQKGRILVNGLDLKDINLRSWRKLVGYVSQDTFLFNTTVKENILVGKPDASEEEIISAARNANADHFVKELPKGYDTVLGDRGLRISGGQRQRIAIARALIRDPEVLIFDEAMSAVDSGSESLIRESIRGLAGSKTIILISHRLSTVKDADTIYVLDNGRIVESGTFEELLKDKGLIHKMGTG